MPMPTPSPSANASFLVDPHARLRYIIDFSFTHERTRIALDAVARRDLRPAHVGAVHDHARVFGLREKHPWR